LAGDDRRNCRQDNEGNEPPELACRPVEIWFQDEARVGQHGTLTRILGQARHPSADQARSAVYLGLPVRRHLPGARHRRRVGHAGSQHRGHEPTSGRNQPMRQRQCRRPFDPRRCRLAQFATTHRARQHRAHAAAAHRAGAELSRSFGELRTSGTICAATFSATASLTPMRQSSRRVAMPATP